MVQLHAYFSGTVQGVGFRYTVERYARQLGICGWVRNLPDGRVELKAEAQKSVLGELLRLLAEHFEGMIRQTQIYWDDQIDGFSSFQITF